MVAIDGTGIITFAARHCEHCLTKKVHGKDIFYHYVLEAKLVTRTGFSFSIMTEFAENPHEFPEKQDCELKAFYRLAASLATLRTQYRAIFEVFTYLNDLDNILGWIKSAIPKPHTH